MVFYKKLITFLKYSIIPAICLIITYSIGTELQWPFSKTSPYYGLRTVILGVIISCLVYVLLKYVPFFELLDHTDKSIINQALLCGILSAESILYLHDRENHIEIQRILLFLFLYFHNLEL